MTILDKALKIAIKAHFGQVDKRGEPYILHPLRVMFSIREKGMGPLAQAAAVLHDVAEDHADGWNMILKGNLGEVVYHAVDSVTRRENEDYFDYVRRAKANPIGREIKLADLKDNMDIKRKPMIDKNRETRMTKYAKARKILMDG